MWEVPCQFWKSMRLMPNASTVSHENAHDIDIEFSFCQQPEQGAATTGTKQRFVSYTVPRWAEKHDPPAAASAPPKRSFGDDESIWLPCTVSSEPSLGFFVPRPSANTAISLVLPLASTGRDGLCFDLQRRTSCFDGCRGRIDVKCRTARHARVLVEHQGGPPNKSTLPWSTRLTEISRAARHCSS